MSTSLLYHAFGIRGYQYTRTDYQGGEVIFSIHQEPHTCRCSACGSPEVKPRGHVQRRFRTVPIGSKTTIVALPIPRVECPACGVVRQVEVSFADPRLTYTKAFERYALESPRSMTIRRCRPPPGRRLGPDQGDHSRRSLAPLRQARKTPST